MTKKLRVLTMADESFCQQYLVQPTMLKTIENSTIDTTGWENKAKSARASQMMGRENIKARIKELMELRCLRIGVDADWVLSKAVAIFDDAILKQDGKLALDALKAIGKHVDVQAFKDKVEVEIVDHAAILEARIAAAERLRKQIN